MGHLPRQGDLHRRRRERRRLAQRPGLAPLLPLRAGRRVRGGDRRPDRASGPSPSGARSRCATAALQRIDAPEGTFRRRRRRQLGARWRARRRGCRAARAPRCASTRPTRAATAARGGTRRRGRARRQASARHRRADRSGPVRADHQAVQRPRRGARHGRLGQDDGGAAPHRLPGLRRPGDRRRAHAGRRVLARRCATTSRTCCRRSACRRARVLHVPRVGARAAPAPLPDAAARRLATTRRRWCSG